MRFDNATRLYRKIRRSPTILLHDNRVSIFASGVYKATAPDPRISCSQLQKESRVRLSVRKAA
jgi:hypothetical protein